MHDPIPFLGRDRERVVARVDAHSEDHDVDSAVIGDRAFDHVAHVSAAFDITGDRVDGVPFARRFARNPFQRRVESGSQGLDGVRAAAITLAPSRASATT